LRGGAPPRPPTEVGGSPNVARSRRNSPPPATGARGTPYEVADPDVPPSLAPSRGRHEA
jgi:hypothetical protein